MADIVGNSLIALKDSFLIQGLIHADIHKGFLGNEVTVKSVLSVTPLCLLWVLVKCPSTTFTLILKRAGQWGEILWILSHYWSLVKINSLSPWIKGILNKLSPRFRAGNTHHITSCLWLVPPQLHTWRAARWISGSWMWCSHRTPDNGRETLIYFILARIKLKATVLIQWYHFHSLRLHKNPIDLEMTFNPWG